MRPIKRAIPLLAGALLALSAYADNPAQGGVSRDLEKEFKALDRNGDGYLSREEAGQNAALKGGFQAADKNRDGKLDMAEFQALEANTSPDRSLGSVPAESAGQGTASGGTAPR